MTARALLLFLVALASPAALGQPIVTEVMYDPASGEPDWEWLEIFNPNATPFDLDEYLIDRVGDRQQSDSTPRQIRSSVDLGDRVVANPTIIPAGGLAVLYNGDGLNWNTQRFRNAWPQLPLGVPLIGVDGWAGNSLGNSPAPPVVDESLAGLTFGFWSSESHYESDTADLGAPDEPDERVVGVASAAFSFSYDNVDPWPENNAAASIVYDGSGSTTAGGSWSLSEAGAGSAFESVATFLSEPINGADVGSPGAVPGGTPSRQLTITEIMYNPESVTGSREWEWVEIYNNGPSIDFAINGHWLDDDDGSPLDTPNVNSGSIPSGGVGVLFNSEAVDLASMQQAWGAGINFIPVDDWGLFNNSGDVVGLWDDEADYLEDFEADDTVANAAAGVVYDDGDPWPSDNGTESIWLTSLSADPLDGDSWSRAKGATEDPNAVTAASVFASGGLPDNAGGDIGSPGFYSAAAAGPLPGDYNGDGSVDAGDYVVWRGGGPLSNETVSPGLVDALDYVAWTQAYGAFGGSTAVPEPLGTSLFFLSCGGCIPTRERV